MRGYRHTVTWAEHSCLQAAAHGKALTAAPAAFSVHPTFSFGLIYLRLHMWLLLWIWGLLFRIGAAVSLWLPPEPYSVGLLSQCLKDWIKSLHTVVGIFPAPRVAVMKFPPYAVKDWNVENVTTQRKPERLKFTNKTMASVYGAQLWEMLWAFPISWKATQEWLDIHSVPG
jgi:hypothetical protein